MPSPPFDPRQIRDFRGALSRAESPAGVVCVAYEEIINASVNFGLAETGYIEPHDLAPRLGYLGAQLNSVLASIRELRHKLPLDSEISTFVDALTSGLQSSLSDLKKFKADLREPATISIDKVGDILATNLPIEQLQGFDAFTAAAAADANCAL